MTDGLRDLRKRIGDALADDGPEHFDEDVAWILAPVMRDYAAEHLRRQALTLETIGYQSAAAILRANADKLEDDRVAALAAEEPGVEPSD